MSIRLNSTARVFLALLFAGSFIAAAAATNSIASIEFPISELGNCANKAACKAYCENPENESTCQEFAEKHGFADAYDAEARLEEIEKDGGPGGCARDSEDPAEDCRNYCDSPSHIEECVLYAREHNLMEGEELEEAEKVLAALKRGVKLPPQCTNAQNCRAVCEDPKDLKTARACFEFGKEAGLLPDDVSVEEAEKAFAALESGKGPFKSFAEMRQCDDPPNDDVFEKCIAFATEAGFLEPEELEMIRKTGGKGPGGCRGREQCDLYCEEHQEECFEFAKQHDLLTEEDKERMQDGVEQMQDALEEAPPEVVSCIRGEVPTLDAILAGEKAPSPSIGQKMEKCFRSFYENQAREEFGGMGEGRDEGGFGGEFGGDFGPPPESFGPPEGFPPRGEEGFDPRRGPADFETDGEHDGERGEGFRPEGGGPPPEEYRREYERRMNERVPDEVRRETERQYEEQYRDEYQKRYQEEYNRQFNQEFERQFKGQFENQMNRFENQGGGFAPPEGMPHEPPPPPPDMRPQSRLFPSDGSLGSLVAGVLYVLMGGR